MTGTGFARGVAAAVLAGGLVLAGSPGPAAAVGAASAGAKKPKPFPLPAATSWVGGERLIHSGELLSLAPGTPKPPVPKAAAWLVADLGTRQILAGRNVHVPLATASTMKIFTALALAPRLDPKTVYTATAADADIDGTKVGLVPGSRYTVDQLLHGMIMSSGNDCANALASFFGGQAKASALLQAEATSLGAFDTVPRTTTGLDAAGQVSSVYDLALAGSAAVTNPQLEKLMTTKTYVFPAAGKTFGGKRKHFQIQSHDHLLWNLPGATGVKNGFTEAARGSFVGTATRGGHSYVAVVLRDEGDPEQQSADLLNWAFAHGSRAAAIGTLVRPGELSGPTGPGLPATPTAASTAASTGTPTPVRVPAGRLAPASLTGGGTRMPGHLWLLALSALAALGALAWSQRGRLSGGGRRRH
jgi:D-alanyl-D-alanine carboxypeptidase (penicillin-binding protein 5/6)